MAEVLCVLAKIFLPVSAEAASPAGNKGINAYTFAEKMSVGFIEDLVDNTRKLVAEDDIRRIIYMTAESLLGPWILTVIVTNVTAAYTAFGDFDEYLSGRKFRPRNVHYFKLLG
jgi:hypothetical protein